MKRSITLFAFCVFLIPALFSPPVFSQNHADVEQLIQGNTQFAIDLYKRIKTTEAGNLFFSPYSISTAASMTYGGARGDTAKQMVDVFHFSLEDQKLHHAFADIQSRLNLIQRQKKIELHVANSLWPQDKYPFLIEYLELVRNCYGAKIEPVDYDRDPEAARRRINAWVEKKTKNRIQDIIPDTRFLTTPTRLVPANAIYFKGEWFRRFEKSSTEEMLFYPEKNETIKVPMMTQTSDFNYGEDEIVQVLEMPYTGSELSMVIVLPREIDGLHNVEETITENSLKKWNKNFYENPVDVYLPRFRMTSELNLKDVLKAMGMTDAFVMDKANFSGMDGEGNQTGCTSDSPRIRRSLM
jgi:serpin B